MKVYDLGGLGFGEQLTVYDDSFINNGYYNIMNSKSGWCSRGLHKPQMILNTKFDNMLVYMDSDAYPVSRFDEINTLDFDVGVTVRDGENYGKMSRINAGVIFFKNTVKSHEFMLSWRNRTIEINNDQIALAEEVATGNYKILELPTRIYNYYYFPEPPDENVKIYHFKSAIGVRNEFDIYAK